MLTSLRVLISRLGGFARDSRRDADLRDEIQAHLDRLESDYLARGVSPADARFAARKAFGGVDQVRTLHRDQRGLPILDALSQDARFAVRLLMRDKAFTLTAILVLGLGIGVNTMQFAVFDAHLLRGLPIPEPHRVLYISTFDERQADGGISYQDFEDLRRAVTTFSNLAAYTVGPAIIGEAGRAPERREGARVSADAFAQLGIQPILGRAILPGDGEGTEPIALIGQALWTSRYGADPGLVGRTILIDRVPTTIVGVVPDRSGFPSGAEVFRPLAQTPGIQEQSRAVRTLRVFGRLRDDVDPGQARAEIESLTERFALEHGQTSAGNRSRVVSINERFLGTAQPQWYAFLSVGILIAAISAANVANLITARSLRRGREMAIRTSLGASRTRIIGQLLVESGVLCVLGAAVGFGLASAGIRLFAGAVPSGLLPYWFLYEMDLRAFAALTAIALAALLISGLLPALQTSRADVNATLKDTTAAGMRPAARRWTAAFLTAELSLAVVMLAYLVLTLRSTNQLPADRTVDRPDVLTASVALPVERYPGSDQRLRFFQRLRDDLSALAGVTAVSVGSHLPASGAAERILEVDGRPDPDPDGPRVWSIAVAPGYFETLGVGVVRGRTIEEADGSPGRMNAVVNERFAELFFSGEDPLDRRIALIAPEAGNRPRDWLTIVGVTPSISRFGNVEAEPLAYVPLSTTAPAAASLLLRSDTDAAALSPLVRNAVASLDPDLFIFRVLTMDQVVYETAWSRRVGDFLIALFAFIAASLASVGLYAVTVHYVGLRTREIGVRMALGATRMRIWRMVVRGALVRVVAALGLGLLGTMAWERTFEIGSRTGVRLTDPGSMLLVAAILVTVSVAACLAPARRAIRLNPVAALRTE